MYRTCTLMSGEACQDLVSFKQDVWGNYDLGTYSEYYSVHQPILSVNTGTEDKYSTDYTLQASMLMVHSIMAMRKQDPSGILCKYSPNARF